MDLSKLSDADLDALSKGDWGSVSDAGLIYLAGEGNPAPAKPAAPATPREPNLLERVSANPLTRFAAGAASPLLGLGELVLPKQYGGDYVAELTKERQALINAGNRGEDDPVGGAAEVAGNIMSPAFLKLGKMMPAAKTVGGLAAQGGLMGGLGAAVTPTGSADLGDKAEAAQSGAIAGGLMTPVVGKTLSWASSKTPVQRAKKVIEDVYKDRLPFVRSLWSTAPADVTAAQAAQPAGSTTGAALGERAAKYDSQYFDDLARAQKARRLARIESLAGGQSQTEAMVAAQGAKKALNATTTPLREAELEAANTAGRLLPRLSGESERLASGATDKVDDVRRMVAAGERAAGRANTTYPVPGQPRMPGRYTYMNELAQRAEDVANRAADDSLILGEGARFAQSRADSLAAHGLTPLDTKAITGEIADELNDPKLAANTPVHTALRNVAEEISYWTAKNGGIIDAQALYAIRKNAVNAAIQKHLAGNDPKVQQKAAAGVLKIVQPMIDDAIETAGGTGWRNYLSEYSKGMTLINQQKLGAKALELLNRNPESFTRLVRGNDPKTVRKIFEGDFDVKSAMGNKFPVLDKVAREVERDADLANKAAAGTVELGQILAKDAGRVWLPQFINYKLALAKKGGDVVEGVLNAKTMNKVYYGMRSGKNAEEILSAIPANERNAFLKLLPSLTALGGGVAAGSGAQQ